MRSYSCVFSIRTLDTRTTYAGCGLVRRVFGPGAAARPGIEACGAASSAQRRKRPCTVIMKALFRRRAEPARTLPAPSIPAGLRVYAVGDIHGRSDLLDRLHAKISADLDAGP